jgi:hypothetical protein
MMGRNKFHLRIDGGDEQIFVSRHSAYSHAVMEAFGVLGLPYPCEVEIWVPDLMEAGYGPYFYRIGDFDDGRGNRYGCPAVMNVFR